MNPAPPDHTRVLDHTGIAARVPHAFAMCLLNGLRSWSAEHVECSATSHRDAANPLRTSHGLASCAAIEYASQAMALHGTLCAAAQGTPTPGFLASVRGVRLRVPRLDDVAGELTVQARRLAGDAGQALYGFAVCDDTGAVLVDGRATVILNARP